MQSHPPSLNPNSVSPSPKIKDRLQNQVSRHARLLIGLGIGSLLLIGVPAVRKQLTALPTSATEATEALPVDVLTVEPVSSYQVSRSYTGEIVALRTSELGFERSGQLTDVLAEEGDRVSAGQSLAQLDTRNLQTQRRQLEAQKAQALAQLTELQAGPRAEDIAAAAAAVRDLEQQLALQQTQRNRREFLYQEGAISREQLDEFSFGAESLEARLDQARSNLQELQNGTRQEQIVAQQALVRQFDAQIADVDVNIRKSTLTAPFDGVISTRQVDEGTVVNAGQSVIRLVENAAPEARIGMPSTAVNRLQIGLEQTLRLGGKTYQATVNSILPEVDPDTRTQVVVFTLESSAIPSLSPGQTARVELTETIPTDGVWLPSEALTQGIRGLWTSYVIVPSENADEDIYTAEPKSVEILHQADNRVLVRGTLQPGERIVATGVHRLVPNQQVIPLHP